MKDDIFNNLNNEQLEAVRCTEGPLLILAGAGSGKTTVLINRIANILQSNLANPWEILAITFTNKAADELKTRLDSKVGPSSLDIWALTFHSACVRMLRYDADYVGYDKYFTIYDTNDSLSLIKHIFKDFDLDEKMFSPKAVLSEISKAKDAHVLPNEYAETAKNNCDFLKIKYAQIYSEYQKRLKQSNAMDFDDLILNTVILLESFEDIRKYWRNKFKYILIDEYQDTNQLQYKLVSLLVNDRKNICVVGDDNQSIYKFRGATIENILNFENEYSGCKVIKLEQNYRSTSHILDAANNVIKNNIERKDKELWTDLGEGNLVELYVADNEYEEAEYVTSVIMNGFSQGMNYNDFTILYRMNAQSNNFEYSFKRHSIPYKIYGGTKFFDRAEVKDVISYLCVIASPNDDLRLERIINNPPRGIGQKSVQTALEIAHSEGCSLFEILKHADSYPELSRPAARMRQFSTMIEELREFSQLNTPDLLFDELLDKTGYLKMYEEKDDPENESRCENINEIKSTILIFMQDNEDSSLESYLSTVALFTDLDNLDTSEGCVSLMTMHASKGLEFNTVFIVGAEESIFPGIKAIGNSEEMEEERRLCYVAITRAKRNLYMVCAKHRMLFGRTQTNRVSRFVNEIPEEHIHKNIPPGYAYNDNRTTIQYRYTPQKTSFEPQLVNSKLSEQSIDFNIGDNVRHKAFGEGVIINITPMGNDALLEINFSEIGTVKKLMKRAASKFLELI